MGIFEHDEQLIETVDRFDNMEGQVQVNHI